MSLNENRMLVDSDNRPSSLARRMHASHVVNVEENPGSASLLRRNRTRSETLIQSVPEYILVHHRAESAAPNRSAELSLQFLNLIPIELPEVWMVVQSMPCFHRRDLSFEVDAR